MSELGAEAFGRWLLEMRRQRTFQLHDTMVWLKCACPWSFPSSYWRRPRAASWELDKSEQAATTNGEAVS
jgi:hypothetical protein